MGKTKLTGKETIDIENEACKMSNEKDMEECPYVPDMQEICEDIYDSLKAYCEYYDLSLLENCHACDLLDFINIFKFKF